MCLSHLHINRWMAEAVVGDLGTSCNLCQGSAATKAFRLGSGKLITSAYSSSRLCSSAAIAYSFAESTLPSVDSGVC